MDFHKVRRTGATYGKTSKKVLVHDFFEHRNPRNILASPEATEDIPDTAASQDEKSKQTVSTYPPAVAERSSPRSSPALSIASSANSQPVISNGASLDRADVFDLSSSEEEYARIQKERDVTKRRKVAQHPRDVSNSRARRGVHTAVQPDRTNNENNYTSTVSSERPGRLVHVGYAGRSKAQKGIKKSRATSREGFMLQISDPEIRPHLPILKAGQDSAYRSKPYKNDADAAVDSSGHLTDHSTQSISSTPKRKRPLSQYSDESISSPSSLGFTSLRLTPERNLLSKRAVSISPTSEEEETPRKVRTRLIDRLDAPQVRPDSPKGDVSDPSSQRPTTKADDVDIVTAANVSSDSQMGETRPASLPSVEQAQSARVRATYGTKARTTYAKERSHLSETTEDIDLLNGAPGANLSQHLGNQHSASNLAMQLELDDDEDGEQAAASKIKSIHELRKAGANNRFDREVQGLLEDIENESPSARSVRLQALIKFIRRSKDSNFSRYLLDTGRWNRLAISASSSPDIVSATLFAISLIMLGDAASASVGPKMFDVACKLVPELLKCNDPLLSIASERKSNLSKSLIRDLSSAEDYVLQHVLVDKYQGGSIYPSAIALLLLKQTLRNCTELGSSAEKGLKECYMDVSKVLITDSKALNSGQRSELILERIKAALQVLEAFSIAFENLDTNLSEKGSQDLGSGLAAIMLWARDNDERFNKHVLQAIVNLSNNRPRVCHLFASTDITDIIFSIIHDHFQTVAAQADQEQTVDDATLELVILALVCLLNFLESDVDTRTDLSTRARDGHNYTEHLVGIFNSQASKVEEATTQEQSKVLVAVGYLSMVLCTMSLDLTVRQQITKLLQNKSFAELCNAAETFFQHLCTVEEIGGDDGSTSTFIARFNAILETVRQPTR